MIVDNAQRPSAPRRRRSNRPVFVDLDCLTSEQREIWDPLLPNRRPRHTARPARPRSLSSARPVGVRAGRCARQLRDSLRPAQAVLSGLQRRFGRTGPLRPRSGNRLRTWGFRSTKRKGRDSNPGDRSRGLTVFKTAAFNRSATLPRGPQMLGNRSVPVGRLYTGMPVPRRGGRAAEGTRLLSEYGDQTPSRVRIPPSPSRGRRATTAPAIQTGAGAALA